MRRNRLNDVVRGVLLEADQQQYATFSDDPYTDIGIKIAIIYGLPILTKYLIGALATVGAIKVADVLTKAASDRDFAKAEYLRRKQIDAGGQLTIKATNSSDRTVTISKVYGGYVVFGSAPGKPPPAPGAKTGAVETQGIMGNTMISAFRVLFNDKPHSDAIEVDIPDVQVPPGATVDVTVAHPGSVDIDGPFVAVHALATMGEPGHEASTYLPVGFVGRNMPQHVLVISQEVANELEKEADKTLRKDVKRAEKDVLGPYDPGPSRVPYGTSRTAAEAEAKYEEGLDYMDRGDFGNAALSFAEAVDAGAGMKAHLMRIRAYIRQGDASDFPESAQSYYKLALQELQAVQGFATGATREQKAEAESFKRQVLKKMGKI